jgi:hypothetical protein
MLVPQAWKSCRDFGSRFGLVEDTYTLKISSPTSSHITIMY